jgi:hypothetical protein
VAGVALPRRRVAVDEADPATDRPVSRAGDPLALEPGQLFLQRVLGGVVELAPTRLEELDAVVAERVVRRRDHGGRHPVGLGQVGHARGRQHADVDHRRALGREAGAQRGRQQRP